MPHLPPKCISRNGLVPNSSDLRSRWETAAPPPDPLAPSSVNCQAKTTSINATRLNVTTLSRERGTVSMNGIRGGRACPLNGLRSAGLADHRGSCENVRIAVDLLDLRCFVRPG